jgi:hypothetical protein
MYAILQCNCSNYIITRETNVSTLILFYLKIIIFVQSFNFFLDTLNEDYLKLAVTFQGNLAIINQWHNRKAGKYIFIVNICSNLLHSVIMTNQFSLRCDFRLQLEGWSVTVMETQMSISVEYAQTR